MTGQVLTRLYTYMLDQIGGRSNDDVDWYLNGRPKTVT